MRGDGPAPDAAPFQIEKLNPGLDTLVSPDAELEQMAEGFGLNEGPVWVPDGNEGYLLVSSLLDNAIYKIAPDKSVSVFMEFSGYSGDRPDTVGMQTRSGRSHVLLIGSGCASLNSERRLVWCAKNDLAIKRLETDGTHTVIADNHEGRHFSGPNDLVIKSNGSLYFTDTDSGLRDGNDSPLKAMSNGVWLVKDGKTRQLLTKATLGGPPNGIALSPDEDYLYLSAHPYIKRYPIREDDTLGEGAVFSEGEGIGDGIKVDTEGNVYSTNGAGPGIVRIMSAEGKHLGSLRLPVYGKEPKKQICATNLAFGDTDGKSLYITACDVVYRVRMNVAGIVPGVDRR